MQTLLASVYKISLYVHNTTLYKCSRYTNARHRLISLASQKDASVVALPLASPALSRDLSTRGLPACERAVE